jgi:hypothetical protein
MINSVRNTVLSVLNKNNYGYISPSDFNLFAKQAQMELFEEYFSDYNKTITMENTRTSGTDYADRSKMLAEAIEVFLSVKYLTPVPQAFSIPSNSFFMPSLTTTGDEAFLMNKVVCYSQQIANGTNSSVSTSLLIDITATFISSGVAFGDVVVNITTGVVATVLSVSSQTTLVVDADIFLASPNQYVVYSSASYYEAEKVSAGKIAMLNNSLLTSPSIQYPAYVQYGDTMKVYPVSINSLGMVQATYFRYPKAPKWTYVTLVNGEPSFDQTQVDYQDFELPEEDEVKLVVKILKYSGLSIRETDIASYAIGQEQSQNQQ